VSLWIVIPAFDEAATIAAVVERARGHGPVLVVDDGSTDDTAILARAAGAEVIRHPRRRGKGQALRSGMAAAVVRGATAVVTLDGDGQHDPDDIAVLRAAAERTPGALVVGGRLALSAGLPRGRWNAIRVAGFFTNWATGLSVEDTQSGFRLYPSGLVRDLPTGRGGFVFETEVLVEVARRGVAVREVAVTTLPRAARRSRFRPLVDGIRIGAYLAECGLARWLVETKDGLRAVAAVVGRERRVARHTGMLVEASPYRDAPGLWAAAIGAGAGQRALARITHWWRHPRRRRASATAWGMALLPLLLVVAVAQALFSRFAPDLVTPIVSRWFSQTRLTALEPSRTLAPRIVDAPTAAEPFAAPPAVSS